MRICKRNSDVLRIVESKVLASVGDDEPILHRSAKEDESRSHIRINDEVDGNAGDRHRLQADALFAKIAESELELQAGISGAATLAQRRDAIDDGLRCLRVDTTND